MVQFIPIIPNFTQAVPNVPNVPIRSEHGYTCVAQYIIRHLLGFVLQCVASSYL